MFKRFSVFVFAFSCLPLTAQTTGATAPEVTQFKPVDISDLVQLSNGDFGYSFPAVTIPGAPGGSYPIALSYQAGIKHGQEATWVGLGWNLHPGTVSRFVRSAPDDDFGALKVTETPLPSVYGYSVGFGYQGFNIGVTWDNHGGFGGEVGYSYISETKKGGNAVGSLSVSAHNRNGVSASVGFSPGHVSGAGFSINTNGGVGLSAGNAGKSTGVSISSQGDVGISYGFMAGTKHDSIKGGQVYSSSNFGSVGLHLFNFGFGRVSGGKIRSYSESWGALHFDHIGESWPPGSADPEVVRRKLDMTTNAMGSYLQGEGARFAGTFQNRVNQFDLDTTYQRRIPVARNRDEFKHVSVTLDSYNQNLSGAYAFESSDDDSRESVSANEAFLADYVTTSYDGYSIAAQGLSGLARPVQNTRGFSGFSARSMATAVTDIDDEWYFHSYRSLYHLLEADGDLIRWDLELEPFFKKSSWSAVSPNEQDNMVMLNDPGLQVDNHFFGSIESRSLADTTLPGGEIQPGDAKHKRQHIEHRSQRVRYELDEEGRIARIIVTKTDGIRYTFGLLQDRYGLTTAGARPMNHYELRESQRVHNITDGTDAATIRETRQDPYAYAWHIAAVTSPDFVDREPLGHYGPEDFGAYITFHYALTNPSYKWQTPYGGENEQPYALIGRSAADDKFTRERSSGSKDFYHLLYAKTRTHMAVFDHDHQRLDNLAAATDLTPTASRFTFLPGLHFKSVGTTLMGEAPHPDLDRLTSHFSGNVASSQRENELLLLFNPGTVARLGATLEEPIDVYLRSVDPFYNPAFPETVWRANMSYLGSWDYGNLEVFKIDLGALPIDHIPYHARKGFFSSIIVPREQINGSISLQSIRVFRRDAVLDDFFVGSRPDRLLTRDVNQFLTVSLQNRHLSKTKFHYSYDLAHGYGNVLTSPEGQVDPTTSDVPNPKKAKLTLKELTFHAANSDLTMGNGYQFDYFSQPAKQFSRVSFAKDPWGYPSERSTPLSTRVSPDFFSTPELEHIPVQATDSLSSIVTPVGSRIRIEYEHDRYSWVQDRAALNRDFPLGGESATATPLRSWDHTNPGPILFSQPDQLGQNEQPLPVAQILGSLAQMTWADPGTSVWRDQVVVVATGTSRTKCTQLTPEGECNPNGSIDANQHRFIVPSRQINSATWSLPITSAQETPSEGVALHPAVRDLANWIWHEIDHRDGNLVRLEILPIPGRLVEDSLNRQVSTPYVTDFMRPRDENHNSPFHLGEVGGGLRVAAIHSEPAQHRDWFGEQASTTITYDYKDPVSGLESGVIYADPPKYIHGVGGDQRVVRSESMPSLYMPGADVHYGAVTTRLVKPGMTNGSTVYRMLTANDHRIIQQSFSQSIKNYPQEQPNRAVVAWNPSNPDSQLFRFHPRGNQDDGWEAIPINQRNPVTFSLVSQIRNRVVHNSNLIGQVAERTLRDSLNRPISRVRHDYQGAFEANRDPLPVKRFYRDDTGAIREANLNNRYASDPGLNPRIQGAFIDKTFGFGIGRNDGNGYSYRVNAFFQDEVWNTFRRVATTEELFERVGDTEQVAVRDSQVLALDYSTGQEAIGVEKVMSPQGGYRYLYSWLIPGHEIWDAEKKPGGMKAKNMLTQPGFSMSFLADRDLWTDQETPWLTKLQTLPTMGLSAQLTAWEEFDFDQGSVASWFQSASFGYQANLSGSPIQATQNLPLPGASGTTWNNIYPLPSGGRWQSTGQVTQFDRVGNAIETRDRLGNYHSLIYESSNQRVIAKVAYAKQEQVFFEDFENAAAIQQGTGVYPPHKVRVSGHSLGPPSPIVPDTKTAEAFLAQFDQAYTGQYAATGNIRLELGQFVKAPNRPYYLSFYCKPMGDNTLTISTSSSPVVVQLEPGIQQEGRVHVETQQRGWHYVVVQLTTDQVNHLQLGAAAALIDAVALYPAAGDGSVEAFLNHYSYDPLYHQVASITDARGYTARYQYNAKGQLWRTYDTDGDLVTEHLRIEHERVNQGEPSP